jgi:hypothetical protein
MHFQFPPAAETKLRQADRLDQDVLPGLISSSQGASTAGELLPDMVLLSAAQDDASRQRAREATDRAFAAITEFEGVYRPKITSDEDRRMFEAAITGHGNVTERYNSAVADGVISEGELAALRPVVERYGATMDALLELNKRNGLAASHSIRESVSVSLWTLVPAITLATVLGMERRFAFCGVDLAPAVEQVLDDLADGGFRVGRRIGGGGGGDGEEEEEEESEGFEGQDRARVHGGVWARRASSSAMRCCNGSTAARTSAIE